MKKIIKLNKIKENKRKKEKNLIYIFNEFIYLLNL
jgi:hypothetical protein